MTITTTADWHSLLAPTPDTMEQLFDADWDLAEEFPDLLKQFNATEVHPVEVFACFANQVQPEEVGSNPQAEYYWSAYLHWRDGGIYWVADYHTQEEAEACAKRLDAVLGVGPNGIAD